MSTIQITDDPVILKPRSGESSRRTGYMYPYARMAMDVVAALAGRLAVSSERTEAYLADFRATAGVSDQHAEFVAAVLALVDTSAAHQSERQAAERERRNPKCPSQIADKDAEREAIKSAFAAAFPAECGE